MRQAFLITIAEGKAEPSRVEPSRAIFVINFNYDWNSRYFEYFPSFVFFLGSNGSSFSSSLSLDETKEIVKALIIRIESRWMRGWMSWSETNDLIIEIDKSNNDDSDPYLPTCLPGCLSALFYLVLSGKYTSWWRWQAKRDGMGWDYSPERHEVVSTLNSSCWTANR